MRDFLLVFSIDEKKRRDDLESGLVVQTPMQREGKRKRDIYEGGWKRGQGRTETPYAATHLLGRKFANRIMQPLTFFLICVIERNFDRLNFN